MFKTSLVHVISFIFLKKRSYTCTTKLCSIWTSTSFHPTLTALINYLSCAVLKLCATLWCEEGRYMCVNNHIPNVVLSLPLISKLLKSTHLSDLFLKTFFLPENMKNVFVLFQCVLLVAYFIQILTSITSNAKKNYLHYLIQGKIL